MGMGDWGMDGAICAGALPLQPASSFESDGYVISGFTAADAADIPRAFTAVYGHDYLSSVVYDPEAFAALVAGSLGRANACTPVTNAHLVCRPSLVQKKTNSYINTTVN